METVGLVFKYTQKEYVKAARQYMITSKTIRKRDPVFLAVGFATSIFCLLISSFSAPSIALFAAILIVAAIGGFLYFYAPVLKFRQTAKYQEEYRLTFSEDGIGFKTPSIDSRLNWSVYPEAWISGDFYFLIQAPQVYTLIPRRAFLSDADMRVFENILIKMIKTIKVIK